MSKNEGQNVPVHGRQKERKKLTTGYAWLQIELSSNCNLRQVIDGQSKAKDAAEFKWGGSEQEDTRRRQCGQLVINFQTSPKLIYVQSSFGENQQQNRMLQTSQK